MVILVDLVTVLTCGAHAVHATMCASASFRPEGELAPFVRMVAQGSGGAGEGFEVQKYGDGRVALIGTSVPRLRFVPYVMLLSVHLDSLFCC